MTHQKPEPRVDFVRGTPQGNTIARRSLLVLIGIGLFVVVALVQLGENGILAFSHLRVRAADLQHEVATLEADNAEMSAKTEAITRDPEALEKFAREKYNMRRAEEEVLVFVPVTKEGR